MTQGHPATERRARSWVRADRRSWTLRSLSLSLVAWTSAAYALWWSWDRGEPYRTEIQLRLDVKVEAAPLVGRLVWDPRPAHLIPLIIGALIIFGWPRVSRRVSFGRASVLAACATGSFAVALAATDGLGRIMDPVVDPTEYWVNLDTLPPMSQTLSSWSQVDFLLNYTTHLKGHPPGFILVLQTLEAVGLGDPWTVALLSWLSLAAITPGVMVIVRQIDSDERARSLAPFLAVAPFAIWTATSADSFFACLLVWGSAFVTLAVTRQSRRSVALFGLGGGTTLGFALFSSYGVSVALLVPLSLLLWTQRSTWHTRLLCAGAAAVGALVVTGGFWAAGFWWFDGLATTKDFYEWGTAQFRPQTYFVVANVAALLIAMGPAFVGAVGRIDRSRVWVPVGAAVAAVSAANLSTMSKAEVERIWLIFMPFLMIATSKLRRPKLWLCVQLAVAVTLQMWLRTKW